MQPDLPCADQIMKKPQVLGHIKSQQGDADDLQQEQPLSLMAYIPNIIHNLAYNLQHTPINLAITNTMLWLSNYLRDYPNSYYT